MDLKVKYVIRDVDRYGKERWYYRAPGCKKIKLPSPTSPDFFSELAQAKMAAQPPEDAPTAAEGSFRWLCLAYYESAAYRLLAEDTRHVRKRILDSFCQKHGHKPFKLLDSQHIIKFRDEKVDTPEAANTLLKAIRSVFNWALDAKHVKVNPARDVKKLQSHNPDGWHTWTVEEIEKFKERWPLGTRPYLALMLLQCTLVRRSDVVRLGKQMLDKNGNLRFIEWKGRGRKRTRKERIIPILPQLQEAIDACPTGDLTFLVNDLGRPMASGSFGNWFKDCCKEAGLPHCSAHGMRKAAACIAAENGATSQELMALGGWTKLDQVDRYIQKVNRNKLTQSAMHKVVQLPFPKKSNS